MRVKPTALSAIVAILGYMVVVFTVWGVTGLKYDEVGDTVENVQKGVVLSIGLGAIYLVIVTTVLGWWKRVIREPRKVGGGWMWLIPALLLVGAVVNLASTKWGEIDDVGKYVAWLAIGTIFVADLAAIFAPERFKICMTSSRVTSFPTNMPLRLPMAW